MTDAVPPVVVVVDEEVTIIEVIEEEAVLATEDEDTVVLETAAEQGISGASVVPTSDTVVEGVDNLYFTNARALSAAPAETGVTLGVLNAAATSKGTLVDADTLPITDTEAANVLKKVTVAVLRTAIVTLTAIAARLAAAAAKNPPVDADTFPIIDSADSSAAKQVTFANLKATIATYYNSVAATLTNKVITALTLSAGTVSAAPLKFTAGTDLTVAEAGAMEYNGTVFKVTPATGRGVVPAILFAVRQTDRAQISNTAENPIFTEAGAAGTITLPVGTYRVDMRIFVDRTATSMAVRAGFRNTSGVMAITGRFRTFNAVDAVNQTSSGNTWTTGFSYTAMTQLSGTTQGGCIEFEGLLRVTTAGALIPSIAQSVASAGATVQAGSYVVFTPVGDGTVISQGAWS